MLRPRALIIIIALLTACGDDTEPLPDGGVDDAGVDGASLTVAPPDIPWLEDGVPPIGLTPCPDGFRSVEDATGVSVCDPMPEGGVSVCTFGEAHFAGEPGCRPVGDPCPTGDYADSVPSTGAVVYVNAATTSGGDGSMTSPYRSLSEVGWTSLASGTTVALARGTYDGGLPLNAGVHVIGACAAGTRVTGTSAPLSAAITVTSSGDPATVSNVAVSSPEQMAAFVDDDHALDLDGVVLDGALETGLWVEGDGAVVHANDLVVTNTREVGGDRGEGVVVITGARFEASALVVAGNHGLGVAIQGAGTSVSLSDASVRETSSPSGGGSARGIGMQGGAELVGTRLLVEDNEELGIFVGSAGTRAELSDTIVRSTDEMTAAAGLVVEDGGALEAFRLLLSANGSIGLMISGAGSAVVAEDLVIRDTRPERDGDFGRGVLVQLGGSLEASRVLVARNHDLGLMALDPGSRTILSDAVVVATAARQSDERFGRGIGVQTGTRFEGARLLISRNRDVGFVLIGEGASASLTDVVIEATESRLANGLEGRGLVAHTGATLDVTRLLVADNRDVGIGIASEGTTATLTDVHIRDTQPRAEDGAFGYGLAAQIGARVTATRLRIDGAHEMGILGVSGATIDGRGVVVDTTHASECTCSDRVFGYGAAVLGASLSLTDFEIRGAETCGLFLSDAPEEMTLGVVDAQMGLIEGSAIGACVQVDGYELQRLSQDVVYRDNGTNLDSTTLPVPDAPATADEAL